MAPGAAAGQPNHWRGKGTERQRRGAAWLYVAWPPPRAATRAERIHVVRLRPDVETHLPAAARGEAVFDATELARDRGKEVGRLAERVSEARPLPTLARIAAADLVAVGQQHLGDAGLQPGGRRVARRVAAWDT